MNNKDIKKTVNVLFHGESIGTKELTTTQIRTMESWEGFSIEEITRD